MNHMTWQTSDSATAAAETSIDPQNPFENPLENREYRTDYRRILPQILLPSFQIPLFPDQMERRAIRRRMNAAGLGAFLSSLAPQFLFALVELIVLAMMGISMSDYLSGNVAEALHYFESSSILIALNGLIFAATNTTTALCGCRSLRIAPRSLFQSERLKAGTVLRYIVTGIGLQFAAGLIYIVVQYFFAKNGVELSEADFSYFQSAKSTIAVVLYTCILAPITEELLYRGFLMKALSCVGVRFGIVVSALLFGLAHGNISQFLLGFLGGLFFGKIVARHNSLVPSILVHMGINCTSTLLNLLSEKATGTIGAGITAIVVLLYYGVAILGLVFWFWKERRDPLPYPTQKQATRNRVFWSSPWLLAAFALNIGLILLSIWMNTTM